MAEATDPTALLDLLLVDDSEVDRILVRRLLTRPYRIREASTAREARALFAAARELDVGALICEIARSEIGYTDQRPAEYVTVMIAGGVLNYAVYAVLLTHSGLVRDWPRPGGDVHKHVGYAFQWYSMAALAAGLWLWFVLLAPLRARTKPEDSR